MYVAHRSTVLHRPYSLDGRSAGRGSPTASPSRAAQNLASSELSANLGSAAITSSIKDQSKCIPTLRNCSNKSDIYQTKESSMLGRTMQVPVQRARGQSFPDFLTMISALNADSTGSLTINTSFASGFMAAMRLAA